MQFCYVSFNWPGTRPLMQHNSSQGGTVRPTAAPPAASISARSVELNKISIYESQCTVHLHRRLSLLENPQNIRINCAKRVYQVQEIRSAASRPRPRSFCSSLVLVSILDRALGLSLSHGSHLRNEIMNYSQRATRLIILLKVNINASSFVNYNLHSM